MSAVRSFSGLDVALAAPASHEIRITDIAHHLSLINRFCGATSLPLSVAQHSAYVAKLVGRMGAKPREQLAALLHDAHEAYLGDITRPLFAILPEGAREFLSRLRHHLDGVILGRFGLDHTDFSTRIRLADDMALLAEWRDLMEGPLPQTGIASALPGPWSVKPLHWMKAEEDFLNLFHRLSIEAGLTLAPHGRASDLVK